MALINCTECGKEISDKATSCPHCGNPMNQPVPKEEEYLCCPKCHSRELHAEQKGFSGGKALAGAIVTGGIGLLAGTIGSKEVQVTCLKCNNRFKAGEALIEIGENAKSKLEQDIADLLRNDQTAKAFDLYKSKTNHDFKNGMDYLHEVAKKYNIEIKQNKGCSILLLILIGFGSLMFIL